MKSKSKKIIEITLILNEMEAMWLKSCMQNFQGPHEEAEGIEHREYREGLFNLLDEELGGP